MTPSGGDQFNEYLDYAEAPMNKIGKLFQLVSDRKELVIT